MTSKTLTQDALTAAIEQVRAYRLDAMKVPVGALPDIAPPAFPTADGLEVAEYAPVAACAACAALENVGGAL